MESLKLTATSSDNGIRLDAFISKNENIVSRSAAVRLIEEENVLINGKPAKKNHKMTENDLVEVNIPKAKTVDLQPQDMKLDIIYEDTHVLVINKPKGMVVHPAPGNPDNTVVNAVMYHCKGSLSGIGGEQRPGIVHRIDKDTSGLLIVAKNDSAHIKLSNQLKDRSLSRVYQAVVVGNIRDEKGTIDAPIGRSPKNRKKMAVVQGGRRAVTHYEVLGRYKGFTHVQCRLETGRTHQIRVHMAHIGHPIAGDIVYGGKSDKALCGQCLHAGQLKFIHPDTGEQIVVTCPLPKYFTDFLEKLGDVNG